MFESIEKFMQVSNHGLRFVFLVEFVAPQWHNIFSKCLYTFFYQNSNFRRRSYIIVDQTQRPFSKSIIQLHKLSHPESAVIKKIWGSKEKSWLRCQPVSVAFIITQGLHKCGCSGRSCTHCTHTFFQKGCFAPTEIFQNQSIGVAKKIDKT